MGRIGVLALQGGYAAHSKTLKKLGHQPVEVRYPAHLHGLDGLVFPGGESTTQLKLIELADLTQPLQAFVDAGKPVLTTCAGTILTATHVSRPQQRSFGWLDIDVERNAWGRQVHSFEAVIDGGEERFVGRETIFIRAPRITRVGDDVEVIATLKDEPVMVKSANVTAATFHPELTEDVTIHQAVFGRAQLQPAAEGGR